jgi:dTDP-4-amino-4,6-dideoxygalactose transaminase
VALVTVMKNNMSLSEDPIYVTKPHLPALERVNPYLEGIWERGILTNGGPLHVQLEVELEDYLGVPHLQLCNNGTSALIAALLAADLKGEVITSPFTFAATTHAIQLSCLTPVFADIDTQNYGLCPEAVERAITPETTAILAVHVYGRPSNVDGLAEVAKRHGLKLLYDASHAFGCKYKGQSLLNYGDYSTLSFHATKVFNTFEGGAVVCNTKEDAENIDLIKNFGISGEVDIPQVGFNGKMNEFSAAVGLVQLGDVSDITNSRRALSELYDQELTRESAIVIPPEIEDFDGNYSYYPVIISDSCSVSRDAVMARMNTLNIFPRKYFYPLMSNTTAYKHLPSSAASLLPNATKISNNVICLPIYPSLQKHELVRICDALRSAVSK